MAKPQTVHKQTLPKLDFRNYSAFSRMAAMEKSVVLVGVDDSEHSFHALKWTLQHFFPPASENSPYNLVVVNAKPSAATAVGFTCIGAAEVLPFVERDLRRIAARVLENAKEICFAKSVDEVTLEAVEGDPRNVLCDAVEKHRASILVVGSHGYGAMQRAVLGSVSDYCVHHAHCSVMVVKMPPKIKA